MYIWLSVNCKNWSIQGIRVEEKGQQIAGKPAAVLMQEWGCQIASEGWDSGVAVIFPSAELAHGDRTHPDLHLRASRIHWPWHLLPEIERHSGNHIPVKRPLLYHLGSAMWLCSFPLPSPVPDTYPISWPLLRRHPRAFSTTTKSSWDQSNN